MNRFFVNRENISGDKIFVTEKEDIHHIMRVLRLKKADKIEISDGLVSEYLAQICEIQSGVIICEALGKLEITHEPSIKVALFQGLPKQGKMELIIQKVVELGGFAVTPCIFARSINTDAKKANAKTDRWQKIAKEAAAQSKRRIIPAVNECLKMGELKGELSGFDLILLAYEDERNTSIKDAISKLGEKPDKIALIVGPEGGFEKSEVEMLVQAGAVCVSLGKSILRTETAGICAVSMLNYALDM